MLLVPPKTPPKPRKLGVMGLLFESVWGTSQKSHYSDFWSCFYQGRVNHEVHAHCELKRWNSGG